MQPVLLMDGPLLQRAVGVVQTVDITRTNSTIPLSPSPFIEGSTGILTDHNPVPSLYHPLFAKVLQQYTNRDPVLLPGICDGICEVSVSAPGWDIECSDSSDLIDLRISSSRKTIITRATISITAQGVARSERTRLTMVRYQCRRCLMSMWASTPSS